MARLNLTFENDKNNTANGVKILKFLYENGSTGRKEINRRLFNKSESYFYADTYYALRDAGLLSSNGRTYSITLKGCNYLVGKKAINFTNKASIESFVYSKEDGRSKRTVLVLKETEELLTGLELSYLNKKQVRNATALIANKVPVNSEEKVAGWDDAWNSAIRCYSKANIL